MSGMLHFLRAAAIARHCRAHVIPRAPHQRGSVSVSPLRYLDTSSLQQQRRGLEVKSLKSSALLLLLAAALLVSHAAEAQFRQQGPKLVGTGAAGGAAQGSSVAISADGNTAIVGGLGDNNSAGAVWIFMRSGGVWTQQGPKLVGTGAVGGARQGSSVAISADGNTAIVGGPVDDFDVNFESAGAAWIFTRSGGVWTQQGPKLVGTGAVGGAAQGSSVAISADGNTAIVGGRGDNDNTGAAWVFTRSGSVWTQQGAKLVGTGAVGSAAQAWSVAISADGDTAIVGGPSDDQSQHGVGAAWVFTRSGGVWTQQGPKLVGTGEAPGGASLGWSVALSADGNTAIVGAPEDHPGGNFVGAAWVFARNAGVWTQQGAKLVGTGAAGFNLLQGSAVALSADGNKAIVGGPGDDGGRGATWVFTRSGEAWSQQGDKLVGEGEVGSAGLGGSVALSGDDNTAIVGGLGDDDAGAAWVYAPRPGAIVYTPLEPCRIMDTRNATPGSGVQGPILGNTLYQIPGFVGLGSHWAPYGGNGSADCGLTNPPGVDIHAVAVVITILNPNFGAFVGVSDADALTTVLSNVALNFTQGQGLSTLYIVPQIANHNIYFALPAQLSVQLIFDVVGYYTLSDATTLQCTQQTSAPTAIAGSGGTGTATSPPCGAGYTLTSGSCDSDIFGPALYKHERSEASGNTWMCAAINRAGVAGHLTATANCCRVRGK